MQQIVILAGAARELAKLVDLDRRAGTLAEPDGMVAPLCRRREAGALVDLGEGGLSEVGLALEERFPVTVAASGDGLDILVSTRQVG